LPDLTGKPVVVAMNDEAGNFSGVKRLHAALDEAAGKTKAA
jgi:hypothetical protein